MGVFRNECRARSSSDTQVVVDGCRPISSRFHRELVRINRQRCVSRDEEERAVDISSYKASCENVGDVLLVSCGLVRRRVF